jgi:hypothetical protein
MAKIDPEVERQRLAKLYATMNDLELAEVAGEPTALSEWAFEALRNEINKRGLDWAGGSAALATLREAASVKTDESGNVPEVLRVYRDMTDALTDRMVLEGAGIECYLFDENMVRLDWLWSNLLGGVKLVVRKEDVEEAERLLGQNVPEKFDLEGAGQYEQPRCPKCGSMDVSFEGLMKRVAGAGLFLGLPIIVKMNGWNCNSCEHQWGIEDEDRDTAKTREEGPKPL